MKISLSSELSDLDLGIISVPISNLETIINESIKIFSIIVVMYLSIKIGNRLINKFVETQIKSNARLSIDTQKAKTLGAVLKSVLKYTTYFIGIAMIASSFFGGVSVAMASVGGVALGLGAQSLVKDVINGFFILFEDQYGVGDHVTIGQYSGIIENIGIRTTSIRDFTGDLHLIPNGTVNEVTNHSRGNIRFIVDVDISYEDDIDKVTAIISKVNEEFEKANEDVQEPITILGINSLNPYSITIRIVGKSKPLKQWSMERNLRKAIKDALEKEGITSPYPKTELISKN